MFLQVDPAELLRLAVGERTDEDDPLGVIRSEDADDLAWEKPVHRQSEHLADYQAALDRLSGEGFLYPCFCTRAEIRAEIARSGAAHGPDGPIYPGLCRSLDDARVRYQCPTVQRVLDWARAAAAPDVAAAQHRAITLALSDDRLQKSQEILRLERDIAARLVRTPYVLLLSFPGINVVSAADYAGEMGPITDYANHRCITGRAGLRPCRYQSDQVDRANGPLVHNCNRKLRAAILGIADNLILCNHHFNVLNHHWKAGGKDPRDIRICVANRFVRISFHMVAGRQVFRHPSVQGRHYILDKLSAFHREHETSAPELLRDLEAAIAQLPRAEYQAEAKPLHEELKRIQEGRRRGPQLLGDILPIVLARLGVSAVQSTASGEEDPH